MMMPHWSATLREMAATLKRIADALENQRHPRRDDDVAAWLKRRRDEAKVGKVAAGSAYRALDQVLDRYRELADYGLTLKSEDDQRGGP